MLVGWQENLATGNTLIDEQHKELFRRIERLADACREGKGRDEVRSLLRFLREYVETHFAAEEELQMKHDFPDFPNHKEEHDAFRRELDSLEGNLAADGATIPLLVMTNSVIFGWLSNHINKMDRAIAVHVRSSSKQKN